VNYTQRALEEASDRLYYVYQSLLDITKALNDAGK
jgi:cysteinyl-tRNA synthetase